MICHRNVKNPKNVRIWGFKDLKIDFTFLRLKLTCIEFFELLILYGSTEIDSLYWCRVITCFMLLQFSDYRSYLNILIALKKLLYAELLNKSRYIIQER